MKRLFLPTLAGLTILAFSACDWNQPDDQWVEVTHETLPFSRIDLETSSSVRLVQSDRYEVVITGWSSDVADTRVRVNNDQLVIDEHGRIDPDQVIRIYLPDLRQIRLLGSGDVYGETEFRINGGMSVENLGSGDMDLLVDVDQADAIVNGSGDILLEGNADNLDIYVGGSGWYRGFNLFTDFCDVHITGSGSAQVLVDRDLDVTIHGSGDVYFRGHPVISTLITGSGHLIDAN